jgi:probable F420-dependent oxidoreductase
MGKIKCGVGLGARASAMDPATFGEFVDALEELAFDSLWLSDGATSAALEPLSALAFAAGRTRALKLGTSTLVLPGRNPVLLARELAGIDVLSGGRFLPAFGLGRLDAREHQAFGVQRNERGSWFDESLQLMRRLWREDSVTHHGPRFDVTELSLGLRPVGRMQVWIGGRSAREYDRAGRLAEGWLGSFQTPTEAGAARAEIEQACERHGRSIEDDHYGMVILYSRTGIEARLAALAGRMRPDLDPADLIPAGADALLDRLRAYVTHGITKFVLIAAGPPAAPADELGWLAPLVRTVEAEG